MIRNATAEDIGYVVENIRSEDKLAFEKFTGLPLGAAIGRIGAAPYVALVLYREVPIAIFGATLNPDGTASTFTFSTAAWPSVVREAIRFGKREFLARMWESGVSQIEVVTMDSQAAWMRLFGGKEDCKLVRNGAIFTRFLIDRPSNLS